MKVFLFLFSIGLCLNSSLPLFAQKKYSLEEVITLAQQESALSLQAKNRRENRYWQYRTYLSNYNPQLSLSGNLPNYARAIIPVPQNDGSDAFRARSQFNMDAQLSLRQTIAATGGEVFISSELQRLNTLSGVNSGITYLAYPVQIGFRQPVFAFNNLRWDKKIEPLRYEESKKRFNEDLEEVALRACDLFFDLLVAQVSLEIAQVNLANNDTILKIGQGRFNLGKIAENDLLQLQLNAMNSSQQVSQARLDIETSQLNLKAFLGNSEDFSSLELLLPQEVPEFTVDPQIAIEQAKNNREAFVQFKRRQIEAERDVAQARGNTGLNMNVFGSFGLSQDAENLAGAYQNPQDQQNLRIGFEIPILDWGRQKSQVRTALSNEELVKSTVSQEQLTFEQEIYLKVRQFEILKQRLDIAKRSDEIAQRRYFIAQKRYLIAKISITDLNIALQEKDLAKRDYLQALRSFWRAYYEIRRLTLYDFEKNEAILHNIEQN